VCYAIEEASSILKEEMSAYLSQMEKSKRSLERIENSRKQSFERLEVHLKQISDTLKEEEEECQS
jgi:GTP1/Obg family GTP-binding protein